MIGLITAATIYAATMKVTEVNLVTDVVTMETATGHEYQMTGCEDWMVGDYASLIMDNKGTAPIEDDEILSAQYSGWTDMFEENEVPDER